MGALCVRFPSHPCSSRLIHCQQTETNRFQKVKELKLMLRAPGGFFGFKHQLCNYETTAVILSQAAPAQHKTQVMRRTRSDFGLGELKAAKLTVSHIHVTAVL